MLIKFSLVALVAGMCIAQSDPYVVQQWKVEDGLPQSTVRCITQTNDGYLWVGTWNGLARFDGVRMTVFNASNTPELLSANIMSLFTNRRGQLWIGTEPGGLVRYAGGQFKRFDSTDGISATRILSINEDRSGNLWCATEIGMYVYDGIRFLHFTEDDGLPRTYANQVLPLPGGGMYLGLVNAGARARLIGDSLFVDSSFPVGGYAVGIDTQGVVWHHVRGIGLVGKSEKDETVDQSFAQSKSGETHILRNQEKWLLLPENVRIVSDNGTRRLPQLDGIEFSDMTTLFEDREGNIWLGKEGAGLVCLRKKNIRVYSKRNGLQSDLIMCGLEDRSGNIWMGSWDKGLLVRRDTSSQRFASVSMPAEVTSIYALSGSHNGGIWVGTWGAGLYHISNNNVQRFSRGIFKEDVSIVSVTEDSIGGLWIGTAHNGVAYVHGDSVTMWNTEKGLSSNRVNSILLTRAGDVWISVSGNGVNRISRGSVFVHKKGSGLNDNNASPMYEDGNGAVWIGTRRGLTRWKPDGENGNGTFASVTEQQGLFDDAVAQIMEDDIGNFWIGAIHGIYRVRRQELNAAADGTIPSVRCFTIGKEDGMLSEETGGGGNPRNWKTADGKLWLSTSAGAVVIDPSTITARTIPPTVLVEDVWVENQRRNLDEEIVLQPGETQIEIRYTGINFSAPEKIRFTYFLEGSDAGWSNATSQRIIRYTNLDPGEYIFRLRGVNNAGMWSVEEASMVVRVLPPYYATWWFRALIALIFLTIGPAIYYVRVRQLTQEKERQIEFSRRLIESQESERKRIATELHDGLGQNLLIIKNKLLLALQSPGREAATTLQVEEASEIVTSTIEEVRSISHNLRPHLLDQLGITKTLRSIVRQANESTGIEFTSEIQDIDGVLSPEQEISLFRIVQESFNNIIKHSGAHAVTVRIVRNDDSINVNISDNGKGFTVPAGHSLSSAAGFGISGMQERARMFGWELKIESIQGMRLSIKIPVSSQ